MNSEQMERAAVTMRSAAEQMERVFTWWQSEAQLQYERNLELVQRLEAAAASLVSRMESATRS